MSEFSILVAEDNDSNYLLLEALLKKEYKIVRASNGQEAIDKFKEGNFDLILMDIKMPIKDGFEATKEIRSISKEIPIIAQTAYAFDADKEKSLEVGCNDYITKPIKAALLRETIKKHITK